GAKSSTDGERHPPSASLQPPGGEHSQSRRGDRQDDEFHPMRQRCAKEKRPIDASVLTPGLGDHEGSDESQHIAYADHQQHREREILEGEEIDPGGAQQKAIAGVESPSTDDPERRWWSGGWSHGQRNGWNGLGADREGEDARRDVTVDRGDRAPAHRINTIDQRRERNGNGRGRPGYGLRRPARPLAPGP